MHSEDNDDMPVGRVLTRREAVRLLAVSGAAALVGCERAANASASADSAAATTRVTASAAGTLPSCVVRPEMTVGPYFLDKQLDRSDIRAEPSTGVVKAGEPLALTFNVSQVSGGACRPLPGAMVDVWHCDAEGSYSGFTDNMAGFKTEGQKFLRGYQVTDAAGVARFTTIYPGWYRGRTVHIHFKVRAPIAGRSDATYEFTSQLFFDEALNDRVFARAPYNGKGTRDTTNARDGIFRDGGSLLMLAVADAKPGFKAAFDIGLDLADTETGKADRMGRGGPPSGRPPGRGGRPPG